MASDGAQAAVVTVEIPSGMLGAAARARYWKPISSTAMSRRDLAFATSGRVTMVPCSYISQNRSRWACGARKTADSSGSTGGRLWMG